MSFKSPKVDAKQYALCVDEGVCSLYCQRRGYASGGCQGRTGWDCNCITKMGSELGWVIVFINDLIDIHWNFCSRSARFLIKFPHGQCWLKEWDDDNKIQFPIPYDHQKADPFFIHSSNPEPRLVYSFSWFSGLACDFLCTSQGWHTPGLCGRFHHPLIWTGSGPFCHDPAEQSVDTCPDLGASRGVSEAHFRT